jgi:arsenite-transporting ATPase
MKIVFFTGKGGVGKSTMAAAAAWQMSEQRRVLIVSLDPAHNLGDIFGVEPGARQVALRERLHLREIDLALRARRYLQREIDTLSDTYKYVQTLNLERYFSILKYSPGLEEYALLSSVEEILAEGEAYDTIIFDTPPTGLTLRFLALPRVTLTWLQRLIAIRRAILKKRYTIQKIRGPSPDGAERGTVLRYEEKDDRVFNRLGALESRYETLNRVLGGEGCSFVVVFNPDRLSLRESGRLLQGLRELELPVRLLIHNKIDAGDLERAGQIEAELRALVDGVPIQRVAYARTLHQDRPGSLYRIPENLIASL